jgi:hypothetical protein
VLPAAVDDAAEPALQDEAGPGVRGQAHPAEGNVRIAAILAIFTNFRRLYSTYTNVMIRIWHKIVLHIVSPKCQFVLVNF